MKCFLAILGAISVSFLLSACGSASAEHPAMSNIPHDIAAQGTKATEANKLNQSDLAIGDLGPEADPAKFTMEQVSQMVTVDDEILALNQEHGSFADFENKWLKVSMIEPWDSNDEYLSIKSPSYINDYFIDDKNYQKCFDGGYLTVIGYCETSGDFFQLENCIFVGSEDITYHEPTEPIYENGYDPNYQIDPNSNVPLDDQIIDGMGNAYRGAANDPNISQEERDAYNDFANAWDFVVGLKRAGY